MSKLTPEQKRKLEEAAPEPTEPIAPTALLQAAKLRQQRELDDLQTHIDTLSEEFATRAAAIVEQGLTQSYQLARQKIGAIDLSFFDSGELPSTAIYALPDGETP